MDNRTTSTPPPSLATPKLILVFNLGGMESRAISADTAEEQAELERRFQLIKPGLAAVNEVWQQNGTGPAE